MCDSGEGEGAEANWWLGVQGMLRWRMAAQRGEKSCSRMGMGDQKAGRRVRAKEICGGEDGEEVKPRVVGRLLGVRVRVRVRVCLCV
eukprot:1505307-Pleurochrysis_carterae.AAC.1